MRRPARIDTERRAGRRARTWNPGPTPVLTLAGRRGAPAAPGINGHQRNGHAVAADGRPAATNGRDIARFAVPDGPAGRWGLLPPFRPLGAPSRRARRSTAVATPPRSGRPAPDPQRRPATAEHGLGRSAADLDQRCTPRYGARYRPPSPAATVPEGIARAAEPVAEEAVEDEPVRSRRRRRAGGSPDERPASDTASRPPRGRKAGWQAATSSFWKELPILVVVALALTFLIQTFIAKVYVSRPGRWRRRCTVAPVATTTACSSTRSTYRFSDPKPGDVVVFRGPDGWTSESTAEEPTNVAVRALQGLGSLIGPAPPDEKDFIKRVIAVGGQTVQCCDSRNRVLVDGKPLDEPYIYFLPDAGTAVKTCSGRSRSRRARCG